MTVGEIWRTCQRDGRALIIKPKKWRHWDGRSDDPQPVAFPDKARRRAVWIMQLYGVLYLCQDAEYPTAYPVVGRVTPDEEITEQTLLAVIRAVQQREG
jgi:hypothetical protein